MWKRKSEWAASESQRVRLERQTEQRRKRAAERKAKLRHLLAKLRCSKDRCDCYDFSQWQWLWRRNPELAQRLRNAGHHMATCKLAKLPYDPEVCSRNWIAAGFSSRQLPWGSNMFALGMYPDLCYDPEDVVDWLKFYKEFVEWARPQGYTEWFECSGIVGQCASCGDLIFPGVLHAGRFVEVDELTGLATLSPLPNFSFDEESADFSLVTFYHLRKEEECDFERQEGKTYREIYTKCDSGIPEISTKWEQLFRPLAHTPGKDVGITEHDYLWLLNQCHVKADWQLREYRVSFAGKLLRGRQPQIEWRSYPPDDWSHAHDART